MSRRIGDGTNTLFWHDRWLGDVPFSRRFSRLFDLVVEKSITVASMFAHGWEEGGEAWRWRRRLWVWEEDMLEECRCLLNNIFLQHSVSDRWIWQPDIEEGYTVCGAYQLLTSQVHHVVDVTEDLIWHKQVPLKGLYSCLEAAAK